MKDLRDTLRGAEKRKARYESGLPVEADGGTRTPDPFITSEVLYQLSYVGARGETIVGLLVA